MSALLFSSSARAGDEFYDAMDLLRAGHTKEAGLIFQRLADAGDCDAQSEYAATLMMGSGVPHDFVEGFRQLSKAADQGEPLSQMTMGDIYYHKRSATNFACPASGCPDGYPPRDLRTAYKWYLLAEQRVFDKKDKAYEAGLLAQIRSDMSSEEKIAGEKMAADWKPTPRLCELRHYY
ncbi:MAG: hypothetical protein ACOH12_14540 [Parvibaculaceae bacterium]